MITTRLINKDEIPSLSGQILEFYKPKYKHQFNMTTLENSAVICLAFDDNKIIGAVRAISDMTRHAMIVDMIVENSHRKQGVGTKLLRLIVGELKKCNVKNIGLTTEPGVEWLSDFYLKNGFKPLENDSVYLELSP